MKRYIRAVLRRISSLVRRSPWLTSRIRTALMRMPGVRARLLRINSYEPVASIARPIPQITAEVIHAIEVVDTEELSPIAQEVIVRLAAHLNNEAH